MRRIPHLTSGLPLEHNIEQLLKSQIVCQSEESRTWSQHWGVAAQVRQGHPFFGGGCNSLHGLVSGEWAGFGTLTATPPPRLHKPGVEPT